MTVKTACDVTVRTLVEIDEVQDNFPVAIVASCNCWYANRRTVRISETTESPLEESEGAMRGSTMLVINNPSLVRYT